ncbi:protein ANTAGONIST OF LIKE HETEROCHROMATIN PROTEIN 1-like [Chelonus insularis]|uniref:protein ANTAGONIST OF LIKE HETEROCHROMATIN PROTEIN 1-like n=1 Tax=Chelonus insularis TaxID=460826 RepID=UPI00158DEBB7|nr:protein ANTAGONIST OF LIKE HETEROCHROMATIN PROTEIN 1-like [Chelonus insularis]
MTQQSFYKLLEEVSPYLTKNSRRQSISAEHRLLITLRYLATGDEVSSQAVEYRIGRSTHHSIINETCAVLAQVLMPKYIKAPDSDQWKAISDGFYQKWNMPNCIGAIDGKRIEIIAPPKSGTMCYNYKKTFSTVLLAVCDHKYKFTFVDIGAYGSESDGGIFARSSFGKALEEDKLNLPKEKTKLPGSNMFTHHFFVGDEAFKISRHMMRPYPGHELTTTQKVFNYRLSRARRTIENTFGILSSKWRVLKRSIHKSLTNTDHIVAACVSLHNFLIFHEQRMYNVQNSFIDLDSDCETEPNYIAELQ